MTREVPCELAERWLSRAIDEEISAEEEALLERHLDTCPRCRSEREKLLMEVQRLESGFAGITAELDDLLRGRLGADRIAGARAPSRPPASGVRRVGAVAALAAVIVAAALFLDRSPPAAGPEVVAEWNAAGLIRIEGGVARLSEGAGSALLASGARVRVPVGGDLSIGFPAGDRARLGADGECALLALGERTEVELVTGRAAFEVEPRSGESFAVLTPHARIEVVGTRFGVIHEAGRTEVGVEEGVVSVTRRYRQGPPLRLGPGGWLQLSWRGMHLDSGGWRDPEAEPAATPGSSPPPAGSSAVAPAGSERAPADGGDGGGGSTEGAPRRPLDVPPGGG